MTMYWSKHVAYILPCVIKTVVLMYKLVLQFVSKHLVMSSFKFRWKLSKPSLVQSSFFLANRLRQDYVHSDIRRMSAVRWKHFFWRHPKGTLLLSSPVIWILDGWTLTKHIVSIIQPSPDAEANMRRFCSIGQNYQIKSRNIVLFLYVSAKSIYRKAKLLNLYIAV